MTSDHRNVLFIIADDWSPLARCYGSEVIRTPHVDALAERGVVFDYAFCTSPSCAVSRACILTGQHSHTHGQYGHCHGIHGFRTHSFMQSTPRILRRRGYATACIGKKHVEPDSVYPFEYEPPVDARSPDDMAAKVTQFLGDNGDRPFYLHVASTYPHRAGASFGNERTHAGITPTPYDPREVVVPPFLPDLPAVRADLAEYYESVSRYDQVVGAVVAALEASGRAAETLIFVTTDHAMPFPGRQGIRVRQRPPLPADRLPPRAAQARHAQPGADELDRLLSHHPGVVRRSGAGGRRAAAGPFAAADPGR